MLRGERLWKQLTFPAKRQDHVHSRINAGDHWVYTQSETLHRNNHEMNQIRDFSQIHRACIWCNYSCWQFAVPSQRSKKTSHLCGYRVTLSTKGGQGADYIALGCHQVNIVTAITLRPDFSSFRVIGEQNSVKHQQQSCSLHYFY